MRTVRFPAGKPALVGGLVVAVATMGIGVSRSFADSGQRPSKGRAVSERHHHDDDDDDHPPAQFISASRSFHLRNFRPDFFLCPNDAPFVVGGGASVTDPRSRAVINVSEPIAGPVPADGWRIGGYNPYSFFLDVSVTIICSRTP